MQRSHQTGTRSSTLQRSHAPPRPCMIVDASLSKATSSSSCITSYLASSQLTREPNSCLRTIISCLVLTTFRRLPAPPSPVPPLPLQVRSELSLTTIFPSSRFYFYHRFGRSF